MGNSFSANQLGECISKSGDEGRYNCPFCITLRGKPDRSAKFYYNRKKRKGHCFKCGAFVIDDSLRDSKEILEELTEPDELTLQQQQYKNQSFKLSGWTVDALTSTIASDYLLNTRHLTADLVEEFNIRYSPQLNGILFPNKLNSDYTDFFQLRTLDSTSKMKYTTTKNAVKPICYLDRIKDGVNSLIIVEGFLSGISAYSHLNKEVCPIVCTGKKLTSFQIDFLKREIRKKNIEQITCCLDGGYMEDNLQLAETLHRELDLDISIFVMNLPFDKDPNDVDNKIFLDYYGDRVKFHPLSKTRIRNIFYKKQV